MSSGSTVPAVLLLMACSQRKTAGLARGRAWDVYDGQLFRILKKLRPAFPCWVYRLRILIVSARYGVIPPGQVIDTYDLRLTPTTARQSSARFGTALRRAVRGQHFQAVHVNLGKEYLLALPDLHSFFRYSDLTWACGGIGRRNAQTRSWVCEQLRT